MSKQEAISLQARRARMLVPTVALATAVSLVAVPAITPPLTTREAQVAATVQHALSTAEVNLAADSTALLKGLQLAANVLANSGAEVGQAVAPIANLLQQPGAAAVDPAEPTPVQAAIQAFLANFQDNGPLIATLAAVAAFTGSQVLADAVDGLVSGGPVGAIIAILQDLLPSGTAATALAAQPLASTPIANLLPQPIANLRPAVAAAPEADPTPGQAAIQAFLANFQDNGPLIATLAAAAAFTGSDVLAAAVDGLVSGGPVGAVIAVISALLPSGTATTALAARSEGGTPISSVAGVFGHNATTSPGRSIVDVLTPRKAAEAEDSGSALEAKADPSEKPRLKVLKSPVTQLRDQTDSGAKGADEGNGLVRKSLQFKPDAILPVGGESGAGAGGGFRPLQGLKDAVDRVTGHGDDAKGSAGASDKGDGGK